jgi:hypothetical protein
LTQRIVSRLLRDGYRQCSPHRGQPVPHQRTFSAHFHQHLTVLAMSPSHPASHAPSAPVRSPVALNAMSPSHPASHAPSRRVTRPPQRPLSRPPRRPFLGRSVLLAAAAALGAGVLASVPESPPVPLLPVLLAAPDDSVVLQTNAGDSGSILFDDWTNLSNYSYASVSTANFLADDRTLITYGSNSATVPLINLITRGGGDIEISGAIGKLYVAHDHSYTVGIDATLTGTKSDDDTGDITINLTPVSTPTNGYSIETRLYKDDSYPSAPVEVVGGYGIRASTAEANNDSQISITSALNIYTTGTGILAKNTGNESTGSIYLENSGNIQASSTALRAEILAPSSHSYGDITIINSGDLNLYINPIINNTVYEIENGTNLVGIYARIGDHINNASWFSAGEITIQNTGKITGTFFAIYANGDGLGGDINITNSGAIESVIETIGAAIWVRMDSASSPTSTRDIYITNNAGGTINSENFGIIAQNENYGAKIEITNNAAITSKSTAIAASYRWSFANSTPQPTDYLGGTYTGSGTISITNTGNIKVDNTASSNNHYGIYANSGNYGGNTTDADIHIENSGKITITGGGSYAIYAEAPVNADITIINNGEINIPDSYAYGIGVKTLEWSGTANSISITNTAPLNLNGGQGIVVISPAASGSITINSAGAITNTSNTTSGTGISIALDRNGALASLGRLVEINITAPITNYSTGVRIQNDASTTAPDTFKIKVAADITALTGITRYPSQPHSGIGANFDITVATGKSITSTSSGIYLPAANNGSVAQVCNVSIKNDGSITNTATATSTIHISALSDIAINNTGTISQNATTAIDYLNGTPCAAIFAITSGKVDITNTGKIATKYPVSDSTDTWSYSYYYGALGIYTTAQKTITINNSGFISSIYAKTTGNVAGDDNSISITNLAGGEVFSETMATKGIEGYVSGTGSSTIINAGVAAALRAGASGNGGVFIENTGTVRNGGYQGGIYAYADGQNGAGVTIINSGTVNSYNFTDYYHGINAYVSDSGWEIQIPSNKNITIQNTSAVYSQGDHGIYAFSEADEWLIENYPNISSTISITNALAGSITTRSSTNFYAKQTPFAIYAVQENQGALNITNAGAITSDFGAIYASGNYATVKIQNTASFSPTVAGIVVSSSQGNVSLTNTGDITAGGVAIALYNVNTGTLYNAGKLTHTNTISSTPDDTISDFAALYIDARNVTVTLAGGAAGLITGNVIFSTESNSQEHGANRSTLTLGTYSQTIIGNLVFTENNRAIFRADAIDPAQVQTLHVAGNVTLSNVQLIFDDRALRGTVVPVGTEFNLILIEGLATNTVTGLISGISGADGANLSAIVPLAEGALYRSITNSIYEVTYSPDLVTPSVNRSVTLRLVSQSSSVIPEPSTYAAVGCTLLAGLLLLCHRRRRKASL